MNDFDSTNWWLPWVLTIVVCLGVYGLVSCVTKDAKERRLACEEMCQQDYPEEFLHCYEIFCKNSY